MQRLLLRDGRQGRHLLLIVGWHKNYKFNFCVASTAFLHAEEEVFVRPPIEFYLDLNVLWKLHKAMYGLKTAPKAWQQHFAETMQSD